MTAITMREIKADLTEVCTKVSEHDKILIRGNGQPSLQEEVRILKNYVGEQKAWLKAIALLFAAQFIAVFIGMVVLFIQVIPDLQRIATETVRLP
jgi:hypothetical protein